MAHVWMLVACFLALAFSVLWLATPTQGGRTKWVWRASITMAIAALVAVMVSGRGNDMADFWIPVGSFLACAFVVLWVVAPTRKAKAKWIWRTTSVIAVATFVAVYEPKYPLWGVLSREEVLGAVNKTLMSLDPETHWVYFDGLGKMRFDSFRFSNDRDPDLLVCASYHRRRGECVVVRWERSRQPIRAVEVSVDGEILTDRALVR